jgi:hypothetical protein
MQHMKNMEKRLFVLSWGVKLHVLHELHGYIGFNIK